MLKSSKAEKNELAQDSHHPISKFTPLSILILIACLSLIVITISAVYYFTIAQPRVERAKIEFEREKYQTTTEMEKTEKLSKEVKILTAEQERDACLLEASENYLSYWKTNCESVKQLSDKNYNDCLSSRQAKYESCKGVSDEPYCKATWLDGKESACEQYKTYIGKDDGSCSLPSERAETVEAARDKNKEECYRKYDLAVK